MLWGENRGKWKRPAAARSRTPLAWAASALPLSHNSWMYVTTSPHNLLYILTTQARGVLGSTAGLFTFLLFHLITSKIDLFLAWAKMLWAFRVRKLLGMGSFLMERIFQLAPNGVLIVFCRQTGLWKPEGRPRNGSLGALSGKDVFVVKLLCYACFPDLWRPFLASETSAEHGDKAACIYKHFQTSY